MNLYFWAYPPWLPTVNAGRFVGCGTQQRVEQEVMNISENSTEALKFIKPCSAQEHTEILSTYTKATSVVYEFNMKNHSMVYNHKHFTEINK